MWNPKRTIVVGAWAASVLICGLADAATAAEFKSLAVCVADGAQEFPTPVLKEDGSLYVLWHDTRQRTRDVYGQYYDPQGQELWDPNGRPLIVLDGEQGWVAAVDDGDDGFVLVWGDNRTGNRNLYIQRFDSRGEARWQPSGQVVCTLEGPKDDLKIALDGAGGFYVVWEDWRDDDLDVLGQHVSAAGDRLWHEQALPICDADGHQYDPVIASGGDGYLVAAWWDVKGPDWRVFAQRVAPDGERLWDVGGLRMCQVEANQSAPVLVSDDAGGAYVMWSDSRRDDGTFSNLDIFGQHVLADGTLAWGESGRAICDAPGTQHQPTAVANGHGGVYVAWTDSRDVYDDIYAQWIGSDGSTKWSADGRPICLGDCRQREPKLALDGDRLWVAWQDYRRETVEETPEDLYVQRIDPDGTFLFQTDGIQLDTRSGSRGSMTLQARLGRAAVTWMDLHADGHDVFAAIWGADDE